MATSSDAQSRQLGKLREFSTQLAERLKQAPNTPAEPTRMAVRIGAENFLIEMDLAAEIVSAPEMAPVPWTQPWYRGLTNVRGRLIGVIDLMHMAGRAPLPTDQAQQLLVLNESLGLNAGILMSRAFGIRNLKDLDSLGAAPAPAFTWEGTRYKDMDGAVLTELNLRELSTSPAFNAIGI